MAIVQGDAAFFQGIIEEAQKEGKKVGVLVTEENAAGYEADLILTCGTKRDLSSIARNLYGVLREFDRQDVDVIYSESFSEAGLGEAIMNRLFKAAGNRIISSD